MVSGSERMNRTAGSLTATARIASWSARHRWVVVGGAVLVMIFAVLTLSSVTAEVRDDGGGVGESGRADDLFDERFSTPADSPQPAAAPTRSERLIFAGQNTQVDDPAFRAAVDAIVAELRGLPRVTEVVSFFDTDDPAMLSPSNRAVLGFVELQARDGRDLNNIDAVIEVVQRGSGEGGFEAGVVSGRLVEDEIDRILDEDFARILLVSLGVGLIILVLAFRALVAAIIPLIMAVGSIFTAIAIATLLSQAYPLVEIYTEMVLLMGLAVGIDYSLFILSRFRGEIADGRPKLEAIEVASNTTGRAVFYAGVTVLLSLAGLMLTFDSTFISLALGAIIVVALTIIASLTLLPALLSILGKNVNRLSLPFLREPDGQGGVWGAITDRVLARPIALATIATALLVALAIPAGFISLGFNAGADALPEAAESKRAVELLEEHFSSSLTNPAWIAVDAPDVSALAVQDSVDTFLARLGTEDSFIPPFEVEANNAGTLLAIRVPLAGNIDDSVSEDAISLLRDEIIPETFVGGEVDVLVAGDTAESIDFRDHMLASVPLVFSFVLGLAFLLMLVMFRSIIIPIKAILLNLLSVAAAYGVLVMVFQWGWGVGLLGSESSDVIESWLPLFLFGILFGLSMDYHMLLLNRIKEEYDRGMGNSESVSSAVRLTAGQITSAAAIMVGVFGAFATSRILGLQQFGLGLGAAVLIDATVIRVILLPATMKLLGDRNWYLPSWLEWLPQVSVPEEAERVPALVGSSRS